ncbi:MAG: G8 domain-containing protein, partial [Bacteroidia bacterium]|nr:G8 domain-containing protein [Bacteroidia bacterium]
MQRTTELSELEYLKLGSRIFSPLLFIILFLFFILFVSSPILAATYYSKVTGNWGDAGTWGTACGSGTGAVPTSADDVIICSEYTITVNISGAVCNALTINSGGFIIISTAGGGKDLTVNSTLTIDGTLTIGNAANRFLDAKGDVIIGSTGSLDNQRKFIMYAGKVFSILGSGTYIHNPSTASDDTMFSLATEDFSASSNVTISTWVNTTTALTANMTGNYGNLTLNYTGGNWEQDGNLGIVNTIQGNFTIGASCIITLDNTKTTDITVTIGGNLTVDGEL